LEVPRASEAGTYFFSLRINQHFANWFIPFAPFFFTYLENSKSGVTAYAALCYLGNGYDQIAFLYK
jgi:hypothetical protein